MEIRRDQFVQVEWHQPSPDRQAYRNGYYRRKTWPTALGTLCDLRVPRCRQQGLTQQIFARLDDHRQALGDSVIDMLSGFLWSLYRRGLTGQSLKLISTDGGGGQRV